MLPVFAITTRGLEAVSAQEMRQLPGVTVTGMAYRRVEAACQELQPLARLRTVDDVFIQLARWQPVTHLRAELGEFAKRSADLILKPALDAIGTMRPLPPAPRFSVTANFVGRRNYTAPEIKTAIQAGLSQRHPAWVYVEDDHDADVNLRVFIEHDTALVGVRITRHPLHRRPYKTDHLPGSLKPSVAAAMLLLAEAAPGQSLVDPFCGTGTILIEAALQGLHVIGGDLQAAAARHARINAEHADCHPQLCQWDARRLPLAAASVDLAVSNLPWGRQIVVNENLKSLYHAALPEMRRVVKPGGRIVLLTGVPELVNAPEAESTEISLFGQNPHIIKIRNDR
ncbi:MAG: methyltransferase domain-containing protein [Chloroflexi bacterium]|nr:methyltransferase domain-containing protein [Chloroflexota bacterium]